MRLNKNTIRQIGGFMLDLITLMFLLTITFSDPKTVDEISREDIAFDTAYANGIVFDVVAVRGSWKKFISKIHPVILTSIDASPDLSSITTSAAKTFVSHSLLYNIFRSDTTINAP